jgi:hypothetical protein
MSSFSSLVGAVFVAGTIYLGYEAFHSKSDDAPANSHYAPHQTEEEISNCITSSNAISGLVGAIAVTVYDRGVNVRFDYDIGPNHFYNGDYERLYVFTDIPNAQSYVEKGKVIPDTTGPYNRVVDRDLRHWFADGLQGAEQQKIQAVKQCIAYALPERRASMGMQGATGLQKLGW